ncbi:MAG: glycine C-acetyltransferase, partial [Dehalococcoidia bacterium]
MAVDVSFLRRLSEDLSALTEHGLYKKERVLQTRQGSHIGVKGHRDVINLCANNYLGLASHKDLLEAARFAIDRHGFGMASVRFICGTHEVHHELERRLAHFLGMEEAILYSSCFDANGGLFETLMGEPDTIISDELNHASIIDGIRLSKARRSRYSNRNMDELEERLIEAVDARSRLIVTDGVFSMDGTVAPLGRICDLAERYNAIVAVDDSHAAGFVGTTGRGTPELSGVVGRIDILTGTLGKAFGGAAGGYAAGRSVVIQMLRQRSRPYLFSNSLPPMIVETALRALDIIEAGDSLRKQLHENARYFRDSLASAGFQLIPGAHPIVPVMFGGAELALRMSERLMDLGIYVIPFSYPVVPKGAARIRTQESAAHTRADLERAVDAFRTAGRELGVI